MLRKLLLTIMIIFNASALLNTANAAQETQKKHHTKKKKKKKKGQQAQSAVSNHTKSKLERAISDDQKTETVDATLDNTPVALTDYENTINDLDFKQLNKLAISLMKQIDAKIQKMPDGCEEKQDNILFLENKKKAYAAFLKGSLLNHLCKKTT
jgi:hypothetical protein